MELKTKKSRNYENDSTKFYIKDNISIRAQDFE